MKSIFYPIWIVRKINPTKLIIPFFLLFQPILPFASQNTIECVAPLLPQEATHSVILSPSPLDFSIDGINTYTLNHYLPPREQAIIQGYLQYRFSEQATPSQKALFGRFYFRFTQRYLNRLERTESNPKETIRRMKLVADLFPRAIFFPTQRSLSILDINHLSPFDVYYLGYIRQPIYADGRLMTPSEFIDHDFDHARLILNLKPKYEPNAFETIVKKVKIYDNFIHFRNLQKEDNRKLLDVIWFHYHHEGEIITHSGAFLIHALRLPVSHQRDQIFREYAGKIIKRAQDPHNYGAYLNSSISAETVIDALNLLSSHNIRFLY